MIRKISIHLRNILFLLLGSLVCGLRFLLRLDLDKSWFVEWEIGRLNSCCIVIILILDSTSLVFSRFVLLISLMVLYYRGVTLTGIKGLFGSCT